MRRIVLTALLGLMLPATAAVVLADEDPQPAAAADQAVIQRLIGQLGADDFRAREEASRKLATYGAKAKAALEKAAAESSSPEVRWRAEQLLRRLRGAEEKPLGAEAPRPTRPEAQPEDAAGLRSEWERAIEEARKHMDELFKQRGQGKSPFGALLGNRRIEAPGLLLERSLTGLVTLRVQRERDGAKVEDVYRGHSLKDILARHPDLAKHAGMEELQRKDAESAWPGLEDFRKHFESWPRLRVETFPNGSGFSFATSQGVEIKQDADGVTVTLREKGEDGKETVKEYKGKTLEELKAKHPELAAKLGQGFSVRISPPTFLWGGRSHRRLDPLRPTRPERPQPPVTGRVVFGLTLDDVDAALASHIGLDEGRGALVHNVVPGTQAERMGVQRNDVIVRVDGKAVDKQSAADALSAAAAASAPLEIELIRRGKHLTLKR